MAGKEINFYGGHADPLASAEQYIESISMEAGSAQLYMEAELGEQGYEASPIGVVVGTPVGATTPADSTEGNTPLSVSGAAAITQGEVKEVIAPAAEGGYTDNLNGDASTPEASGQVGESQGGEHDHTGESAIANRESAINSITEAAEEHGVTVENVEVTENGDGTSTIEVEVAPEASAPAATEEAAPAPANEDPAGEASAPAEVTEGGEHDHTGESAISNIEGSHGNVLSAAGEHGVSGDAPAEEAAPATEEKEEEAPAEEPKEEEKEEDKE